MGWNKRKGDAERRRNKQKHGFGGKRRQSLKEVKIKWRNQDVGTNED